ncbi:MAG: aminotransferase class I/II-fold pyridoxal phosphate-dependent enzyme [Gammaproteobacteria bacterium]|nr:aminotransferase class I/II-fold pyridoxal phosphate-dependent enzyme [Gammaproteobacteria bacterium]NIR81922.1 aminotransferase class I/II-fold pyridoxal phosphate-dependent enzyme [Gammaproteobacteria bacterium]NIR88754.1 aminotransferase class I/II-fold pyridoxal phosphate-dependent enzyme [Gammaproteobacteria bacterium]NIU03030.1 aminotransferase class I/II-fold pyridoxal phosphate-dependent enzyme [Gammaproteobacteria bacterium]NIV50551.1 aminotransferase class I/II-fold pyridoxal phosp
MLERLRQVAAARRELDELGIDPFGIPIERVYAPTEGQVNGRRTILAGTNNYLGLTFDPECLAAARDALEREGTGTTGSRMANGTYPGHLALEREFAEFYGRRYAIVFSTGYQANLGVLGTLAAPGEVALIDADSHASIYDGCRLGGADIIRFRHNSAEDLEKRLRRLGERARGALVVVEGLYSMLGDRAPLTDIAEVKRRHGAYLAVDEAHSLGVFGEQGRGVSEEAGVEADVDFVVGTFSKSLGATGGFCVSDRKELSLLRYASRPYIFTAAPSPSVVASTRVALRSIRERPGLRARLWSNARRLYAALQEMGYRLGPEPSPVIAVVLESKTQALDTWRGLLERGVYVNLMLPPATPNGVSLLRCSMSAAHTPEQIDAISKAFAEIREAAPA